jgi:hypothetical protein
MPWDIIPLLSGSGIRWINKPYLNYDAAFGSLSVPPLFRWTGPDGSEIRVILDKNASSKFCYMQGGGVLKIPPYEKDTSTIESFMQAPRLILEKPRPLVHTAGRALSVSRATGAPG